MFPRPGDHTLRGAAIMAGMALGVIDRSPTAAALTKIDSTFQPDPSAAIYDALYAEFRKL
jgi:hypothetical protein